MLSQVITDKIEDVVDSFVTSNREFTLYEVTVEVRKQVGPSEQFSHPEARPTIEQAVMAHVNSGGYKVDYSKNSSARTFIPNNIIQQQSPNPQTGPMLQSAPLPNPFLTGMSRARGVPSFPVTKLPVGKLNPTYGVSPTLDGRIVIPKEAVRRAGFGVGESLFVNFHHNGPILNDILKSNLDNATSGTQPKQAQSVKVDVRGNIRYKPGFARIGNKYIVRVITEDDGTVAIQVSQH